VVKVKEDSSSPTRMPDRKSKARKRFTVIFYGLSALFGVWLLLSVTIHLFGGQDMRRSRRAIGRRADDPTELYRCWESLYKLFDDLVYDFGHEVLLTRKHDRDLKSTWGERYGWDLLPLSQLPKGERRRAQAGPWRWKLLQTWSWCRLGDDDLVDRSPVLAILREVYVDLDHLRLALTRRIRSFAEPGRTTVHGGTQGLIGDVRDELREARKLSISLIRAKGDLPDVSKLRKWRLERNEAGARR
jgi:hypothetical protein